MNIERRGFLSLLGATIAAPALVKASTGDLRRIEQLITPDGRLIIRGLSLTQVLIEDCIINRPLNEAGVVMRNILINGPPDESLPGAGISFFDRPPLPGLEG